MCVKKIIFLEGCQRKFRTQKRVHKLEIPRLRSVRYKFRVLFRLECKKRRAEFDKKLEALRLEYSRNMLSYNEKFEKERDLLKQSEELSLLHMRSPLGCVWCGNQMEDLVFNPRRQCWFCTVCYEDAHEQYPEEYP